MVKVLKDITKVDGITHGGTMHADEVFATAFLDLYFGDFKVKRVVDTPSEVDNLIVYDILGGKFDHHQKEARVRSNGIKYSSFGLLFEEYGPRYLEMMKVKNSEEVYDYFIKDFVLEIDAVDNGIFPLVNASFKVKMISDIIKLFNPSYLENVDSDEQFLKAVTVAKMILVEEFKYVIGKVEANILVSNLLKDNKEEILVLDKYVPYEEAILNTSNNIKLVIFPSNRGGYAVKTVQKSATDKTSRVYFPKNWGGLNKEELVKITGVDDAIFCHVNRFLFSTKTLDSALEIAKKTILLNETS